MITNKMIKLFLKNKKILVNKKWIDLSIFFILLVQIILNRALDYINELYKNQYILYKCSNIFKLVLKCILELNLYIINV